MFLTACNDDGRFSAKDLVRQDCTFTGKSFINEYEICTQSGRICGGWEKRQSDCMYMNARHLNKVLSTHKLVYDKVE
ncbi:UNVERIFIED_ORG: hypothetical protein [Escherichia phage CMSTMSU]